MLALQATSTQPETWKSVLTLFVLLALFGYLGWKRGPAREIAFLVTIFIASLVQSNQYGPRIVEFINNIALLVQIAVRGRFSLQRMIQVVQSGNISPFIPPERVEAAQFILFFLVLFFGYWISTRLPARPSPVGLFLGLVNGYLIGALVLPWLPSGLPAMLPGGQRASGSDAAQVLEQGMQQLQQVLGLGAVNLIVIVMVFFVLWAAFKLR